MAKAHEVPTPEECLAMGRMCACYNLRRAARAVTQLYDGYFDAVGLKTTQFTVLAVLAHADDHPPTVTTLASSMVLEQSSLSRNLAVLERLGHVRLVPGEDRRERVVTLTRSGRAVLAQGYPVWKRAQAAILGSLETDLEGQLRALRRLTQTALALRPRERDRKRRRNATAK
jgi:DNA-binding MarR family transcriptional regulator